MKAVGKVFIFLVFFVCIETCAQEAFQDENRTELVEVAFVDEVILYDSENAIDQTSPIFDTMFSLQKSSSLFLKSLKSIYLNQPVDQVLLQTLRKEISSFFLQHSRFPVIVSIPEQNISDRQLKINLDRAQLGTAKVEGNRWISSRCTSKYISLRPGDFIDQRRLMRDLYFINHSPFQNVDVIYSPGLDQNSTDLTFYSRDRFPIRPYIGVDNTGVVSTGRNRLFAGVSANYFMGINQILNYQYTSSSDFSKFQASTLEYYAFLPSRHLLKLYGGYAKVHSDVTTLMKNKGYSFQGSLRYIIPFGVTQYLGQECTLGADFKRTNNTLEFSESFLVFGKNVNLTQFALGYHLEYQKDRYLTSLDLETFISPGRVISDESNSDYDSLRPGAKNKWIYGRGAFSYLQNIKNSVVFSALIRGQVSSTPLLPSEQFGIGGFNTVRGYDEREENADNAFLTSLEIRTPGMSILGKKKKTRVKDSLVFLGFWDYGFGNNWDRIPGDSHSTFLMGIGPGVRYNVDSYLNCRLDWGIKLHKSAQIGTSWSRVHFLVSLAY